MWLDARGARDDATPAAGSATSASMAGMDMRTTANLGSLTSLLAQRRITPTLLPRPIRPIRRPFHRQRNGAGGRRAPRPNRRDDPDRARHQVRRLGLPGWRSRPGRPRPPGADRGDDPHERRRDPALDRLPRRAHRAEQGLRRRHARQVVHVPLQGERPGRVHVPLRHEAGARRTSRTACTARSSSTRSTRSQGRPRIRARRQRVVPDERRAHQAGAVRHEQGARDHARLDDVQRLRRPVRRPSADGEPGRSRPLLRRRRRPGARRPTSTSSARS